ncbi:head GIN domain-containing protein [Larkinella insperata]|uniref:Head GIN domain-containing protein n=1 Tax=Larkinella insperata TaxID=332158 RepID=A0ABW3Q3H3_9BACT|nr:head GIN domain-containing protein [Larkinella insperata]
MQTKRLYLSLLIASLVTGFSEAQSITKQFNIKSFDRIDVANAIDVEVRRGSFDIVADLSPGETEYLSVKSENGVLVARFNRPAGSWLPGKNRRSPRLLITMPALRGITLSGASDGDVNDSFDSNELDITLSGAADLSMKDITANRIRVKASGASDTKLRGRVQHLDVEISGASDLSAYDLTAEEAIIRASGASDASVTVTKRLDKNTRGGADVSYRGNPQTVISNEKKSDD